VIPSQTRVQNRRGKSFSCKRGQLKVREGGGGGKSRRGVTKGGASPEAKLLLE